MLNISNKLIIDPAVIEENRSYPCIISENDRGYISIFIGLKSEADARKINANFHHQFLSINYMDEKLPCEFDDIFDKYPVSNEDKNAFNDIGYWVGFGGINSDNYILDAYYPFATPANIEVISKCFEDAGFTSDTDDIKDMKMSVVNCYCTLWEMNGPLTEFDSILNIDTKVLTAADTESFRSKMSREG